MQCENSLCIYRCCGRCILEDVRLNEMGMCSHCIQVRIDEKLLLTEKKKLLKSLHGDELEIMIQKNLAKYR